MGARKEKTEEDIQNEQHDELMIALRNVMSTSAGRKVVYALLDDCNLFGSSFTGNSQTFYLEGRRDVGLTLLGWLEEADPTMYPKLLMDNIESKGT